jgi:hypothetical protein
MHRLAEYSLQGAAEGAGCRSDSQRFLDLTEDLHIAQDGRVQAAGDAEQMSRCRGVSCNS